MQNRKLLSFIKQNKRDPYRRIKTKKYLYTPHSPCWYLQLPALFASPFKNVGLESSKGNFRVCELFKIYHVPEMRLLSFFPEFIPPKISWYTKYVYVCMHIKL